MRSLVILGGGTAGTMAANKLRAKLPRGDWQITVVDQDDIHDYQPGYLFIPFGINTPDQVRRSTHTFLADGIDFVVAEVDIVEPAEQTVRLVGGRVLTYDYLIIASGTTPRPDQTPGMLGDHWHDTVGEFYTFDGAVALRESLTRFTGCLLYTSDAADE